MLIVDHQALVKSLDTYARKTLEDAASVCVEQSAYEVTIEHFLYAASKLAASDVVFILRHYGIQENELQSAIAHTFEQQRIGSQNFVIRAATRCMDHRRAVPGAKESTYRVNFICSTEESYPLPSA